MLSTKRCIVFETSIGRCGTGPTSINPGGRKFLNQHNERIDGPDIVSMWFEDEGTPNGLYVRLFDKPGTLSGDILCLRRDLPPLEGHIEIDGDTVRAVDNPPTPPEEEEEDDLEDLSADLAQLPLIEVDASKHFLKRGKS
ncbi:MAG: hypothetical protein M1816_005369 [Peltula sp. TS41687]|nr:MAG: hypothetical protein M1816_005369 [Peltula sp. TS41687]